MNADFAPLPTGRPAPVAARTADSARSYPRSTDAAVPDMSVPSASSAVQAAAKRAESARAESARVAAEEASRRLAEKGSELTIEFEDALNRMVFRLIDTKTREVVRQIPSEEVLAIARALAADQSSGVLLRGDA